MLSDGYVDWLAIAPEGKFPARTGSSPGATDFVDTWETLPVGVDTEAPAGAVLPAGGARRAAGRPRGRSPAGASPQGQGDLVGASLGELPGAGRGRRGDRAVAPTPQARRASRPPQALRAIQDSLR